MQEYDLGMCPGFAGSAATKIISKDNVRRKKKKGKGKEAPVCPSLDRGDGYGIQHIGQRLHWSGGPRVYASSTPSGQTMDKYGGQWITPGCVEPL